MIADKMPLYKETPLVKQDLYHRDITPLLESFT
jgi:hypothetical protein